MKLKQESTGQVIKNDDDEKSPKNEEENELEKRTGKLSSSK